jgi:isopenicillin N synthase-like dioxygenase
MRSSLYSTGFLYIKNNIVDPLIVSSAHASVHDFFTSPETVKEGAVSKNKALRGYDTIHTHILHMHVSAVH